MKKRIVVSVLIALFIVIGSLGMFYPKERAYATTTAPQITGWETHFSSKLKLSSIRTGHVYVVNEKGEKVQATLTIREDLQSVRVSGLSSGKYVLYVKKHAFKKGSAIVEDQKIPFEIVKKLEAVKSKQQLKNYFATVLKKDNYYNKNFISTEEKLTNAESSKNTTASVEDKASSHSTTNNQVEGIEEGDITVVNNRYIFSAKDQSVTITDIKDASNLQQVESITPSKQGYVHKILLHNQMLLVVVDEYVQQQTAEKRIGYPQGISMTKLFIYDVENPAEPKLVRVVGQEGYFNNIRQAGNTVYMIVNHTPNYWIMEKAKEVELRPLTYDSVKGKSYTPMRYADLSILPDTAEGQYSIIKTIDLSSLDENAVSTKGFLGSSSGLYMSENALYLTGDKYVQQQAPSPATDLIWRPMNVDTDVYKWNVKGTSIDFAGSATVKGTALNQYSMDEHNGYFRIATTEGFAWDETSPSKNHLFILNDTMQIVGQIKDLAQGERIYSARFMGDKAYLVTFKQVDPLFVIDLAEPTSPKVLGELKIPGFSNYLHPLDETHLIGIGYDTKTVIDEYSKQPRELTTSMKLSLFDVSDFTNPKEQQSVLIGGRGSYSEVQHDAKALFRHAEKGLYGFPVTLSTEKDGQEYVYQGSGALIYKITAANGIELKGNLVEPAIQGAQYGDWERTPQRIVYIGDTLFTVSRGEVKSYDLNSFKQLGAMKIK